MMDEPPPARRKRLRAEGFDYAESGAYFVTICVDGMEHRFGSVLSGEVKLNAAGHQVRDAWSNVPQRFPEATIDEFVVMPNHMHGILLLNSLEGEHHHSLSKIIQAFKSITTIEYGRGVRSGMFPRYGRALWQRGFHDWILRNDRMMESAREYIVGNPGRWEEKHGR